MPSLKLLKLTYRDDAPPAEKSPTIIALRSTTITSDSQSTTDSFIGNLDTVSASSSNLPTRAIVGIVICCLFFLFFGAILYCMLRRKKYSKSSEGIKAGMQRKPPILSRQSILLRTLNRDNSAVDHPSTSRDPVDRTGNQTPPPEYSARGTESGRAGTSTTRHDVPSQPRAD